MLRAAVGMLMAATGLVVSVAMAGAGVASAEPGCSIEPVSDRPAVLENGQARIVVSSSCSQLQAAADPAGAFAVEPAAVGPESGGGPLRTFTVTAGANAEKGTVTISSPGGPTLVVAVRPAEAKAPKVEILTSDLEAVFNDDGDTTLRVTVKVTEAPLSSSDLKATISLSDGGQAMSTNAVATILPEVATTPGSGTDAPDPDESSPADKIAPGQSAQLALTFTAEQLTGGGGTLVLAQQGSDAEPITLASAAVTFSRGIPVELTVLFYFGIPAALAVGVTVLAWVIITGRQGRDARAFTDLRAEISIYFLPGSEYEVDPEYTIEPSVVLLLRNYDQQLADADKQLRSGVLPDRAEWTFKDGFAGSLTVFSAVLALVLAATGLVERYLPGVATGPFIASNTFYLGVTTAAVLVFNAFASYKSGEPKGTFFGLYAAAGVTLWGVFGFGCVLVGLLWQAVNDAAKWSFSAAVAIVGLIAVIYAVRNLKGRARQPKAVQDKLAAALEDLQPKIEAAQEKVVLTAPPDASAPPPTTPPTTPPPVEAGPAPTASSAVPDVVPASTVLDATRMIMGDRLGGTAAFAFDALLAGAALDSDDTLIEFSSEGGEPVMTDETSLAVVLDGMANEERTRSERSWGVV